MNTKPTPPSVRIVRVSQIGSSATPTSNVQSYPFIQTALSSSGTPSPLVLSSVQPSTVVTAQPVQTPGGSVVNYESHIGSPLTSLTLPSHAIITIPPKNQPTASQNLVRARSEEVLRRHLTVEATTPISKSSD